jgi:hypothetical protein
MPKLDAYLDQHAKELPLGEPGGLKMDTFTYSPLLSGQEIVVEMLTKAFK